MCSTALTSAIDEDDTTINVTSTDGFLSTDYIVIGDEEILYGGTTDTSFTSCTRGYDGTTPESHAIGDIAYTASASALNAGLGFNVAAMRDDMGLLAFPSIFLQFFTKTIPQVVMWNWNFLTGDLAIMGFFFFASGVALIVTIALSVIGARRV